RSAGLSWMPSLRGSRAGRASRSTGIWPLRPRCWARSSWPAASLLTMCWRLSAKSGRTPWMSPAEWRLRRARRTTRRCGRSSPTPRVGRGNTPLYMEGDFMNARGEKHSGRDRSTPSGSTKTVREHGSSRPSTQTRTVAWATRARIRQDRVITGGSPRMNQAEVFVGIDVAKARLDVALHPSGATWTVPNSEAGIAGLVAQLQQLPVTHIVLEATGGLEIPLLGALGAAGLPAV